MAIIHDAKDQFYSYAKEFLGAELGQLLDSDDKKDEFYSLCKKFSEISLNAPKFKDPKTGKVEGCFQYDDMDSAKEATVEFVKNIIFIISMLLWKAYIDCTDMQLNGMMLERKVVSYKPNRIIIMEVFSEHIIIFNVCRMMYGKIYAKKSLRQSIKNDVITN